MHGFALASKLKRLAVWLDRRCQPEGFVQRQFDGPPFGTCYVTIDASRQGPAASHNLNRVLLCGREPGMEGNGLDRIAALFTAAGVQRFFVWLNPGPDIEVVRGWLAERGASRIRWTGYPTLTRESRGSVPFATDLQIREVGRDEVAAARDRMGDTMWLDFARSAGQEGLFHYLAFDGERPVATAALAVFEGMAYLMAASTAESHRGRGAQQALIARRIETAEKLGCAIVVSETLYMLEQSYRNLQRAGFQVAYEKEVYEWTS
jgi:GNAT superfamily N-acetyltransferase